MGTTAGITTIADVIARMDAIDQALPRKDGVAIFDRLYLAVTGAVDTASAGTNFENRAFLERLDVVFAGLYFDIEDVTPLKTDGALAMWSIVAARDVAWEHGKLLWGLRDHSLLRTGYLDVLVRTTELAARAMLV